MDNPPSKRSKISRGDDDYFPGNIVKIKLHNFMTFDYLKCKPGSRLNLVIGPNGSGKSSIVCAIALGLGGEPQILGRSTSIGAYVKRGKDEGYVEIFLRGATPNEKISVKRKIDKQNKSEWMYNGKLTTKKNVMDMIQELSIQVCNLTQFLPQDRVCEFAKLTPIQLLEETEKAVGDPNLPILHHSLINKSYEVKRLEMTVKRNGETLSQLKAIHSDQERDVVRVRQRDELMEKAETMKKKLPWLKYDMKKVQYMEVKDREKDAKTKLDECAQTLNILKEPVEKQKQQKVLLDSECKKIRYVLDQNNKKWKENMEVALRLGVEIQGMYDEIDELRNQEECRQGKISKANELVAAAELDLENLEPFEPPKAELERLGSQILDLEMSAKQKRLHKSEKENIVSQKKVTLWQCVERLRDMENTSTKLLQALHNSGADMIFQAHKWLLENRHKLNKEVYGPVLLEVNVSNRLHAGYLEGHIPFYIWKSFITQDSTDRDFLVENMRPFDVPVLNYVHSSGTQRAPLRVSEEMRSFGIYSRLDDVFDAPNAVKEVLIGQFGLDGSYIGSRETDQVADQVSKLGILDFWTPENHYRWSRSRYGGHISAIVESVNHSRLLFCSVDSGEIEKLRSRKKEMEESINAIDVSVKSLQSEQKVLEDEASKLHREREEIVNSVQLAKRKRRELENRVEDRRRKLVSLQKEVDVEAEVKRLNFQAKKLNHQRFEHVIGVKNLVLKSVIEKKRYAGKHMEVLEQDSKIKEMESSLKQQEKLAVQSSMHFDSCKTATENFKKELSIAKRQAELVAVITPALEKAFREMPTTIEELQDSIEDNISEANSILLLNQNVIQEYETREHKIKEMTGNQEQDENNLKKCLADIIELRNQWLPKLRDLVSQINRTFGQNFQEMAVAGEVSLDECEQDYDRYGILIKVKFRQTGNLEVLGAHHQSGGERSVSTILYLVSLQDLTNCPFRVVDEINQGMDPINERKMFQQLVRASSQPSVPQCFMVTPKLLPDLEYGEVCTILNVMNGPWIAEASKAWMGGDCWAATMGFVEEGTVKM